MINYNGKVFKAIVNSDNGEVSNGMEFHYKQEGKILTCSYCGEEILMGHLLGRVKDGGVIEMNYHQINRKGEIKTGECVSIPQVLSNGKIRLHESWKWTNGDGSKGNSILEEI